MRDGREMRSLVRVCISERGGFTSVCVHSRCLPSVPRRLFTHTPLRSYCHLRLSVPRVWQLEEEGGGTAGPGRQPQQQEGSESGPEHSQGRSTWKPLVCFHGPAWIPVAWGPCQLWDQWRSPCLRPHPHPQLKGIDRRVRGQGMEAGGLHACASVSACEPKITEQP